MDVAEMVNWINTTYGTTYTLTQRLAGGYQDGAYHLITALGVQHVLKLSYAPRAIPLIQQLHAQGYPTPGTVYVGRTPDHATYLVQEFLPGTSLPGLTRETTEQLLTIIDQQANHNPIPAQNYHESWSHYAHAVIFANQSNWTNLIRHTTPATADLLDGMMRLVVPFELVMLPNTDIVHGDFNLENVLAEQGHITGIVDMLYAGYGTRAIDLATLLHFAYTHDYGDEVRSRLAERIKHLVGYGGLALCLMYRIIAMLAWAIERDQEAIDHYVHCGWHILRDLDC